MLMQIECCGQIVAHCCKHFPCLHGGEQLG
jgi:hypothetical protein